MTTASRELFELCKKCYEATGWKDTHSRLDDSNHTVRNEGNEVLLGTKQVPLYTSDYILEKLPPIIERNCFTMIKDKNDRYEAGYAEYGSITSRGDESDTPLKALLKLTLRLHEDGLL